MTMLERIQVARKAAITENRPPYILRLTEEDERALADEMEAISPYEVNTLREEGGALSSRSTFGDPVVLGMPVHRSDSSYIVAQGKYFPL